MTSSQSHGISIEVNPAQVADYVYRNANPLYLRLLWDYAFLLMPLFIFGGTLLFRFGYCLLSGCCGIGTRYCNLIGLFVFVSILLLVSLLFLAFYPLLDSTI